MNRISDLGTVDGPAQLYPTSYSGFGPDASFALSASQLRAGAHSITLQVQDSNKEVSGFAVAALTVNPPGLANPPVSVTDGTVTSPILAGTDARYSVVYHNTAGTPPDSAYVVINGNRSGLLSNQGDFKAGMAYLFDKTFVSAGTANTFHFEFVVNGTRYNFPATGELSGPTVNPPNPILTSGSVTPAQGDTSTTFSYSVTFQNPSGPGPTPSAVALSVDNALDGIGMSQLVPNGMTWVAAVAGSTLGPGNHTFHFSTAVGGSIHNVRLPTTGELTGPFIGQLNPLNVTVTLSPSYLTNGGFAELDARVFNSLGVNVDVDSFDFFRSPDHYSELVPTHPGVGLYHFHDQAQLPNGYSIFVMNVRKSGYPPTSGYCEVLIGPAPENRVQITNIFALPPAFAPGSAGTTLEYTLTGDAYAVARVYDSSGKLVREIVPANSRQAAGTYSVIWDGKDSLMNPAPPGAYTLELFARSDLSASGNNALYSPSPFTTAAGADDLSDIVYDPSRDVVIAADYGWGQPHFNLPVYSAASSSFLSNIVNCLGQQQPASIAEGTDGSLYVLAIHDVTPTTQHQSIYKYDASGQCDGSWDPRSSAHRFDGNAGNNSALAVSGSRYLYVGYNGGTQESTISKVGLDGSPDVNVPTAGGGQMSVGGIAVDRGGCVWAAEYDTSGGGAWVCRYDQNLNYVDKVQSHVPPTPAVGISVKDGWLLYVLSGLGFDVYDIQNKVWVSPEYPSWFWINTVAARIRTCDNGLTYLLGNLGDNHANIVRAHDRLNGDFQSISLVVSTNIPAATISWPTNGTPIDAVVNPSILVSGTADGTVFAVYTLEEGVGGNPSSWRSITNSTTAVTNGLLGQWVLDGVPAGTNTLRLRVFGADGAVGEARVWVNVASLPSPPRTFVTGVTNAETIPGDAVTLYLSGADQLTPSGRLEYSWHLNGGAWTSFSTNGVISLVGIGRGTNVFEARARNDAGLVDPTPASISFIGTVPHVPDTPVNLYPFPGQTNQPLQARLIGSVFTDRDPAATSGGTEFSISAPTSNVLDIQTSGGVLVVPAGVLQPNTTYLWQLRVKDDLGQLSAWSAETAFSTSPAPILTVSRSGNSVVISWPTTDGVALYTAGGLTPPISWMLGTNVVVANGPMSTVTIAVTTTNAFYQLRSE